jgi:hypothetical protein
MGALRDITGQRFGRLTALHMTTRGSQKPRRQQERWMCKCECDGKEVEVAKAHLMSGHTQSCGCLQIEICKRNATHGHAAGGKVSSEYRTWAGMHDRCTGKNRVDYKRYGGRGITVCERWGQFEAFLADMGLKPSPRHQIDRFPDNNGNYEPSNCRWATPTEQANNTRANRLLTADGQTLTIAEWARETNIHPRALRMRLRRGWHPDWILMPFPGMTFWTG